nr:ribonuclease H-like domain-containing protein [Tanacetum cinerariifolium]
MLLVEVTAGEEERKRHTNSTNEVSTAYGGSTSSDHNSQKEGSSSYIDDLMYSFFSNKYNGPQLDHKDLEQVEELDLEEMDLKWQTGRKLHFDAMEPVGFDKTKVECFNFYNTGQFAREFRSKGNQESRKRDAGNNGYKVRDNRRRPAKQDEHKAMVTIDGKGVDWTSHAEDDTENYALMAFNSSNLGLDTEVTSCSKVCEESYAKLKKLYDEKREQLGDANIEIQAYTLALKKDKSRLGYETQINEEVLSYENEVFERIYMPLKFDFRIDESKFTYGPKQSKTSESDVKTNDLSSCKSNSSVETLESVPKPVESKLKAVSEPKVWSDAPIIEEYESDSDDEYALKAPLEQEKPSCAFISTVKHVKTPRQTVKDQDTCSQNPKIPKKYCTGLMSIRMGLGYGYTRKACFVCGSFSHLIRDGDFHEKRMVKQVELNKRKNKDNPHQTLKGKCIIDSGCSRHMTGNKAYLVEYQDFNGGHVAFGGSKGQITDTECLVLSPEFKLPDENQVLLRVPRQNNMYSFNLENIVPSRDLACLIAKATVDESNKWHMRTKDETSGNLKDFIRQIKNQLNQKVKTIRCDNGTEFKNMDIIEFYASKGIKREYSNPRTPQQNRVTERKNRTLIEPVTAENKANKTDGPKETNYSAAKNGDENLNKNIGSKTTKDPVDQEDQAFLEELESLKRQKKEVDDATKTLRKTFAKSIEDLLLQARAARANSTNNVNTSITAVNIASTPVNTANTPVNTASLSRNVSTAGPSYPVLSTYANQDDSQILSLEDIYAVPNDGIFTSALICVKSHIIFLSKLT